MTANPDRSPQAPRYVHKPARFSAVWQFELATDAIEWTAGTRHGRVPYAGIRRMRLSFRPRSMQTHRFVAEIWPTGGGKLQLASSSPRSMAEYETQDAAYSVFLAELHRRLAAAQSPASFECGLSSLRYWPGVAIFGGVALMLAALIARALSSANRSAAVALGALLAVFLWQGGVFFQRNRPRNYRPEQPPRDLLP
ncbi:MAG TPA: hypothetical protein VGG01_21055 [Xanthobacteraceae bacterium]